MSGTILLMTRLHLPITRLHVMAPIVFAALVTSTVVAQRDPAPAPPRLTGAASDLDQRLARFKPVRMPFNAVGLTARERQMIDQLVIACRYLERMYWRQSDPEGLTLYKQLEQ